MKIALIGYGKMGQLLHQIAKERGHEVMCIVDPLVQCTVHDAECTVMDSDAFRSADVAIEFTTPATAAENIRKAWEQGVPVVSGTTGWDVHQLKVESLKFISEGSSMKVVDERGKVWLIWKSNFSVGVNVFFELNQRLATLLAEYGQYTPSITETHHIHKLDKPSGTAVTLANGIGRDVPIESIREGEVAGIHTVVWDSPEDTITITHSAKSRRGFALGAILAAERLIED